MKKQLLTAFIALAAFAAQAQWINQNVPFGYEGYINDIRIVNTNTVWGNTWDAVLHSSPYTKDWVRTIDGGNTWTAGTVSAPSPYVISNIWPIDADTCYVLMYDSVAGSGGAEYKTTDGGASWFQVGANMFGSATSFADVTYFWDAQNGMAMGDPVGNPKKYEIYLTNDYGNTWTQVPGANLPALTNAAEYAITNLFDAADGRVWFATTYGDVYRTIDNGQTWTKSASGFPAYIPQGGSRQDITNIAFSDSLNGLIMQVNGNTSTIALRSTTDGGLTWNDVPFSGTLFGGDITGVPGTSGTFVSAGSNATFGFGTSFTLDNGANWLEISTNVSHTAIDFLDTLTGWSGEYITAASPGGAWKFDGALATITCANPNINPGNMTVNDSSICFNDTLTVTTLDVLAPTEGTVHGFSVLLSSADISGNNDPISTGLVVGGTGVIQGTPPPTVLINDQTIFPAGVYYFTPIVYGNATDPVGQGNSYDLVYDPNCTFTGTSVYVNLLDFGDPQCIDDGINDFSLATLSVKTYQVSPDLLNVRINTVKSDNNTSIRIFDFTGRVVFENSYSVVKGINDISINASTFSTGTYLLQTISGGAVVTEKLIKM